MTELSNDELLKRFAYASHLARLHANSDRLFALSDDAQLEVSFEIAERMLKNAPHYATKADEFKHELLARMKERPA